MLNSKLIDIFSVLDRKEKKLLSKFIYSPVYNQHKDVIMLFEYIVSLEKYSEENLGKQLVYKIIFPKSKYDDLRLRHVVSYLLRVCEDCLAYIELQKDENLYKLNLLKAYRKRALNKHFENDFLLLKKGMRDSAKKSADNYLSFFRISAEAFGTSIATNNPDALYLEKADTALNFYFVLSKLKNACWLMAYENDAVTSRQHLIQEVLSFIEKEKLNKYPEIETYYCAYKAFEDPAESSLYKVFKEKLSTHALRFELEELKELFALAIQFCKNKLKVENREFERELFEIYLHGLASEALLSNQKLEFEIQKSIVDLGLHLHEISWVQDFINDSKHLTEKLHREEIFRLNTAKIFFAKRNFKACITTLVKEKINKTLVGIDMQRLKISALHELNDTAQLRIENQKLKELLQM